MAEYIERKSLIDHLNQSAAKHYSRAVECVIEQEPAADVAPVQRGWWKPVESPFMAECEECSECGYRTVFRLGWNYCPNYGGAKMEVQNG